MRKGAARRGHRKYFFANPNDGNIQALDWSLFEYQVKISLGPPDAKLFFEDHEKLFSATNFLKQSIVLRAWTDPEEMRSMLKRQGKEELMDCVWATYHPQVRCKLGWYLLWIPNEPHRVVWGEKEVEKILLEKLPARRALL